MSEPKPVYEWRRGQQLSLSRLQDEIRSEISEMAADFARTGHYDTANVIASQRHALAEAISKRLRTNWKVIERGKSQRSLP